MGVKKRLNFYKRLKMYKKQGRLKRAILTNLRWGWRKICRRSGSSSEGSIGRRVIVMTLLLVLFGGLFYAVDYYRGYVVVGEDMLKARLEDPSFNAENPMLAALHSLGSSNRIQITVKTEQRDNLHPKSVDMDRGYLNLVITAADGTRMEYTLENGRVDNFESGKVDYFTLALPDTISVMDTAEFRLVLMPDSKGVYDDWHCEWAQISFLLGGERTLLAKSEWEDTFRFCADTPMAELALTAESNPALHQARELYPYVLTFCEQGNPTAHMQEKKASALKSLGMEQNSNLFYLDVETVGVEQQNTLLRDCTGTVEIPDVDRLNYDGTMTLRVRFIGKTDQGYFIDYPLDNPGKDDFELGGASTFAITMPTDFCVFDIVSMELLVHDPNDAWAFRMARAYLKTDYKTTIELARLTDTAMIAERGTNIVYKGLVETELSPIKLDLNATYRTPTVYKKKIEGTFFNDITGVEYSMYFSNFDYYERQLLFYSQLCGGLQDETK